MRIISVVDNLSQHNLDAEHGLCLWVEACNRRFLFDLGQSDLFMRNARQMMLPIAVADFCIISHGHYDHGGGLSAFVNANGDAPIYIHKHAFADCYSLKDNRTRYIGLNKSLATSHRLVFTEGVIELSPGLILFDGCDGDTLFSPANRRILVKHDDRMLCDDFTHEQSLIIRERGRNILIAGCAHGGIINIMNRAERIIGEKLTDVVSGMHLVGVDDPMFIPQLAHELQKRNCHYYTCHCTGTEAFTALKCIMGPQIDYLSAGDEIN